MSYSKNDKESIKEEQIRRNQVISREMAKHTRETRKNMQMLLESNINTISKKLAETGDLTPFEYYQYMQPMSTMQIYSGEPYTPEQFRLLFDSYKKAVAMINEKSKTPFIPTKKNFCAYIGISSVTLDNLMYGSNSSELRELAIMVNDYITDTQLTLAQTGKIKEISTIFRSKSEGKMYEAAEPVQIYQEKTVNLDDIKQQLQNMKINTSIEVNSSDSSDKKGEKEDGRK